MKKILISFAVFAVAGAAYVGVKATSANSNSSLLVQNVEALASDGEWAETVKKNCSVTGKKGCYADYYGATCNTHTDCSNH